MQRLFAFIGLALFAALGVATFYNRSGFDDGRDRLVGSWQLREKICVRRGEPNKVLDYQDERANLISVLHFRTSDAGVIEEVHLEKKRSCTGRARFKISFLDGERLKLTRGPMNWEGASRSVAQLGCAGDETQETSFFKYRFEGESDELRITQVDHSRACHEVVSVYERDSRKRGPASMNSAPRARKIADQLGEVQALLGADASSSCEAFPNDRAPVRASTIDTSAYFDCLQGLKDASKNWETFYGSSYWERDRLSKAHFPLPDFVQMRDRVMLFPSTGGKDTFVATDEGVFSIPYGNYNLAASLKSGSHYYILKLQLEHKAQPVAVSVRDSGLVKAAQEAYTLRTGYSVDSVGSRLFWYGPDTISVEEASKKDSVFEVVPARVINPDHLEESMEEANAFLKEQAGKIFDYVFIRMALAERERRSIQVWGPQDDGSYEKRRQELARLTRENAELPKRRADLHKVDLSRLPVAAADAIAREMMALEGRAAELPGLLEAAQQLFDSAKRGYDYRQNFLKTGYQKVLDETLEKRASAQKETLAALEGACSRIPAVSKEIQAAIDELKDPKSAVVKREEKKRSRR